MSTMYDHDARTRDALRTLQFAARRSVRSTSAGLGVVAADVEHVVLSHLHWNHASGVHRFPNARFYIQRAEWEFWTADPIATRPPFADLADPVAIDYLTALDGTDRLCVVTGDRQILTGIECVHAPG